MSLVQTELLRPARTGRTRVVDGDPGWRSWGGLALVSVVGIGWLLLVRRHAGREDRAIWRIPMHT